MVLNTSFNIAGEPLVETPADALWCLLATGLDECVIGGCVVVKKNSFHSLLDLYPQLASGQLKVVTTLEDVASGQQTAQHRYLTTICRTPWGDFERFFPWSIVRILEQIDGSTNGKTIFANVSDDGSLLNEVELTRLLLELAHARLISFTEVPCHSLNQSQIVTDEMKVKRSRPFDLLHEVCC
jgi:carbamoyltransferase